MLSIGSLLVEGPTPTAAPGDAVEDAEGAAHSACAGGAPRQRRGRRYAQKARSKQLTPLLRVRVRVLPAPDPVPEPASDPISSRIQSRVRLRVRFHDSFPRARGAA